jgi:hypothetical protein
MTAAASGLISYGLILLAGNLPDWLPLPEAIFRYAPGFLFGALVLQVGTPSLVRRSGIVLGSGLVWILMFQLASLMVTRHEQSSVLACGVAGGLAAWLVSALVYWVKPRRLSLLSMLMAFVAGTLGGCLIGQGLLESGDSLLLDVLLVAGFVLWQAGVAGSLLLVDELGAHDYHG